MGVSWDVKESMVNDLIAAEVGGVENRIQAVAVLQHCSLKDLSLFEFFSQYRVEGMSLIPLAGIPAAAAFVEGDFPAEDDMPPVRQGENDPEWNHSNWREIVGSVSRLECLRKHIAEVASSWGTDCVLWHDLKRYESSLARVVEPVPTLGLVADDEPELGENDGDDESPSDLPSVPVVPPPSAAEQSEIAAVLANPKASTPADAAAVRKDAHGRAFVSEATLVELYDAGDRIGINKVAAQAFVCEKFKLRSVDELHEDTAKKIIAKMKTQAASA